MNSSRSLLSLHSHLDRMAEPVGVAEEQRELLLTDLLDLDLDIVGDGAGGHLAVQVLGEDELEHLADSTVVIFHACKAHDHTEVLQIVRDHIFRLFLLHLIEVKVVESHSDLDGIHLRDIRALLLGELLQLLLSEMGLLRLELVASVAVLLGLDHFAGEGVQLSDDLLDGVLHLAVALSIELHELLDEEALAETGIDNSGEPRHVG
mmetsp:Transcript_16914/g.26029  ORF Transcript_16914/g.26029 Transcript_16914/m.26029 type:complete len:206 (+) Transcript_16914:11-628(+)